MSQSLIYKVLSYLPWELRRILYKLVSNKKDNFLKNRYIIHTKTGTITRSGQCLLKTKSIFIHIPKAAGISIIRSLYNNEEPGHQTICKFMLLLPKKDFNNFYKFSIVRNPISRFTSAYYFLKAGGLKTDYDMSFKNDILSKYKDINDFTLNGCSDVNIMKWIHFKPQVHFLHNFDGKICLDFIGRFENLNKDFEIISKKVTGTSSILPKTNVGPSDPRLPLSTAALQKIHRLYAADFEELGYKFTE